MVHIDQSWFQVDTWLVVVIVIVVVAFIAFAIIWGIRAHRYRVSAGKEEMVGRTAEVETALDPKGVIFVEGERWTAISDKDRVEPGEEVIITRVEGLKLYVTKRE